MVFHKQRWNKHYCPHLQWMDCNKYCTSEQIFGTSPIHHQLPFSNKQTKQWNKIMKHVLNFLNSRCSRLAKWVTFWPWWQPFNSFCFENVSSFPLFSFFFFLLCKKVCGCWMGPCLPPQHHWPRYSKQLLPPLTLK